jgi:rare lipoprotein A
MSRSYDIRRFQVHAQAWFAHVSAPLSPGRRNGRRYMIARASRAIPGMLVTIMLAGPALAALPAEVPHTSRTGPSLEHRRTTNTIGRGHQATAKTLARAKAQTSKASAKLASAAGRQRNAPAQTLAFVDDGFDTSQRSPAQPGWRQTGVASWYGGSRWQGLRTSSGSRFDENGLTAAHATLPLGSRVQVALNHSDRVVVVTITDRPGTRARIIDLSRGAAQALGILNQGVAMVTLSSR